jgi:hypothetical protein
MRVVSHGQGTADGTQLAGQCEFTGEFILDKFIAGNLPGSREYPQGNRQVETSAFLGQIGGSQVHRDAACGKVETAIQQRGAHAILALLHLCFGQPHDRKTGQPISEMDLHRNGGRLHAGKRPAV